MIDHRLIIRCDFAGCPATLLGGPLRHHGSQGDARELEVAAIEMGWHRRPALAIEEKDAVKTEGPWHYCPEHNPERKERAS